MADRYEVVSFKQTQSGKTFAVRLGSAVKSTKNDGFNIYLDAIPAPVDGQYKMTITPPRERQREPGQDDDLSDSVPF